MTLRRLLTAIAATVALSLAFVGTASATTVYDYEYSGTYLDGSTAGKTFTEGIGALFYDDTTDQLYVPNSGEPGWVTRLTKTGAPVNFSSLGSPVRQMVGTGTQIFAPQVTVDNTGGPNDGNFYLAGSGTKFAFRPDGSPISEFNEFGEEICGVAVDKPTGEEIIVPSRNGHYYYRLPNELVQMQIVGAPGFQPGVKKKWEERGKICKLVQDNDRNTYGIRASFFNPLVNKLVKVDPTGVELYEVSAVPSYSAAAIDKLTNDMFALKPEQFGPNATFEHYDDEGRLLGSGFGVAEGSYLGLAGAPIGIVVDPDTQEVWVANRRDYGGGVRRVEKFKPVNPHIIPGVTANDPAYNDPTGATTVLRGTINPDGVATEDCYFEWGASQEFGNVAPCAEGDVHTGTTDQAVTATIAAEKGRRYYYKLFSKNTANGQLASSNTETFIPQDDPLVHFLGVDRVNTDGVRFLTDFDPNGGNASYHFEWGTEGKFQFSSAESGTFGFTSEPGLFEGSDVYRPGVYEEGSEVVGLEPGVTYQYRVVVTNEAGSVTLGPQEFTTYVKDPGVDPCGNAQVRQQTEASLLPDCRAYELVTARNTGGYDVTSDIVPGQDPLDAYPRAKDSLLYSVHFGVIPGMPGSPTNLGRDPYVATRGSDGWNTRYVGLPADGMADDGAFGSPLLGADSQLRTFAFGGPDICDPCYPDGSTNIPLRLPNGSLVKGMAGTEDPAADPVGVVNKTLSDDGSHLVFGSDEVFVETAKTGSHWIYSRDLNGGSTELVSTDENGKPLLGEVASLDVSSDGTRVLVGRYVSEDAAGNEYFDLYMHQAGVEKSILVADTPGGVAFAGMTDDGSEVFFTTADKVGDEVDAGADLFRAAVGTASPAPITRLSTGSGAGDSDSCAPNEGWNAVGGGAGCGVVAIAGGGGVASESGTAYFLSPELLDGGSNGVAGEPNLYVVIPGDAPHFVAVLDEAPYSNPAILDGVEEAGTRNSEDFQVTPDGRYAVFNSVVSLTGYQNLGFSMIFRYDTQEDALLCASCAPTGAVGGSDVTLTPNGLNLTDDGRVFFTTLESFNLRDTNERLDAYEWQMTLSGPKVSLISTGIGQDDSGLLTVSADGVNAFFFTRDSLSKTDENGRAVKVYVARSGGGFLFDQPRPACAASDECHGPGTQPPGPPAINTQTGSEKKNPAPASTKACPKGKVKKKGKCVKKKPKKKKKKKRNKRKGSGKRG